MPLMTKRNFIDGMNQPGKRPREARKKPPPIAVALQQGEGLPVVRMLDRFDRGTGGSVRRLLMEGVKGGLEEGAQELFQQVGDNLIASGLVAYDPERQMFQGTGDAAGVGFTVGALFNVLASMLGVRMRGTGAPEAAPAPETAETPTPAPESAPTAPQPPPVAPEDTAVAPPPSPRPPVPTAAAAIGTAQTGAPFLAELHRGSGRTDQGEAYSGAKVPILGEGSYWTPDSEVALDPGFSSCTT